MENKEKVYENRKHNLQVKYIEKNFLFQLIIKITFLLLRKYTLQKLLKNLTLKLYYFQW